MAFPEDVGANILANLVVGALARAYRSLRPDTSIDAAALARDLEVVESASLRVLLPALAEVVDNEALMRFARSADFEHVLHRLFVLRLADAPAEPVLDEFELVADLLLQTSLDRVRVARAFGALEAFVDDVLQGARERGWVPPADATVEAHQVCVEAHLAAIRRNIGQLQKLSPEELRGASEAEATYRRQVEHRLRLITPPNFGAAKRVSIDEIYVSPRFRRIRTSETVDDPLDYSEFVRQIQRTVLLGDPGGGKSTLSQKLCHDTAHDTLFDPDLAPSRTPFLVVLRDFGARKQREAVSIVEFLEEEGRSKYQAGLPIEHIEFMLANGRALVVFDGLDELLDTSYRREIADDVESFCNRYPSVPVLVTSRSVGYEEAPLAEGFDVFSLAEMSDDQVYEYARKWFALDTEITPDERVALADAFMEESGVVSDLRSNALMLSLMCNIYKGENYIPSNRPDVYEKCARMLFERWDKSRNIRFPLPIEANVMPAMMHLAYEIYSQPGLQSGVIQSALVDMSSSYLLDTKYEDEEEARDVAQQFIDFCTGRAWVFTDVGTTESGERLYQFTHRTFLEYFTAGRLVRRYPTPELLLPVMMPKVSAAEWDVVLQLAVQLLNSRVDAAGDDILGALLQEASQRTDRQKFNLLSFAARCLAFVVPSSRTCREVARACIAHLIDLLDHTSPANSDDSRDDPPVHEPTLLSALQLVSPENRAVVRHEAIAALEEGLARRQPGAGEIIANIGIFDVIDGWLDDVDRVIERHREDVLALAVKHQAQGFAALRRGILRPIDFLDHFGLPQAFTPIEVPLYRAWFMPPALAALSHVTGGFVEPGDDESSLPELISAIAGQLSSSDEGLDIEFEGPLFDLHFVQRNAPSNLLTPTRLGDVAVVSAVFFEIAEQGGNADRMLRVDMGALEPLRPLFEQRLGLSSLETDAGAWLPDTLVRWGRRERNFIATFSRRAPGA